MFSGERINCEMEMKVKTFETHLPNDDLFWEYAFKQTFDEEKQNLETSETLREENERLKAAIKALIRE